MKEIISKVVLGKRLDMEAFNQYLLSGLKRRTDIIVGQERLVYKAGEFITFRVASKNVAAGRPVVEIRAGQHGLEIAGPLTFLIHLDEIVDQVHGNGLGLIAYPAASPSALADPPTLADRSDAAKRFNTDQTGALFGGNDDHMRYEVKRGGRMLTVDEMEQGDELIRWYKPSDPASLAALPPENRYMFEKIEKDLTNNVMAFLDWHQDYLTPTSESFAYHYSYGDLSIYRPIIDKLRQRIPVLANHALTAGYDGRGETCDENGFFQRHDGSLADYMYRRGVKHSIVVETSGVTPLKTAMEVNIIWLRGVTDIIKAKE